MVWYTVPEYSLSGGARGTPYFDQDKTMLGLRGRVLAAAKRPLSRAWLSSSAEGTGSEAEQAMHAALQTRLQAVHVKVTDVSGGCGSMFDIEVASAQFAGQSRVKQHRMVNEILKEEIKDMHGLTIRTMTPEQFQSK